MKEHITVSEILLIAPLKAVNEPARLAALRRSRLLDSECDSDFDAITALVAAICDTSMSVVSLVDAERQWFKSRFGLDAPETPRDLSFCGHAILEPETLMIVPDAMRDPRFCDNPLVTGDPKIRFYAGVPLVDGDGFALGTLCVIDTRSRELTESQLEVLRLASRSVTALIAQRSTIAQLREVTAGQQRIELELREEIAQRKRIEQQLSFSSSHDGLTKLPNRLQFFSRLETALERFKADREKRFAICFIDLDRFKTVNDRLGHSTGDALLVEVSRRLTDVIRSGDAVARLGGDEFTMLVDGAATEDAAYALAARIATVLSSSLSSASDIRVTASIGIVLVDESYTTTEEILRDADIAMYAAKDLGRNRCTIFTTALRDQFAYQTEMQVALRHALDSQEFRLAYQPVMSLQGDGAVTGFEALLRWEAEDGVLVSAAHFIEVAEQMGLIVELGDWVLREACIQARRWQTAGFEPVITAVNVSAKQLAELDFATKVKSIVLAARLDPQLLALEVTESVLIGDVDASIATLQDLRRFGIRIYLDDFGTGYSSLNYLRRFPLDRIKIDRSFVSGADDGLADFVIVSSIVSLAHELGLSVIAEGVETITQRSMLAELGCDAAQGFLYSQAVPAEEATHLLEESRYPAACGF